MTAVIALGGSTNAVLHLLALARRHGGQLATFDRKIEGLLVPSTDSRRLVVLGAAT